MASQRGVALHVWELVDPTVADPVDQDDDKRNNLQLYTRGNFLSKYTEGRDQTYQPIFVSCRYPVKLGQWQLGLLVADFNFQRKLGKNPRKSGPAWCYLGLFRACRAMKGPDPDQFLCSSQPQGKSRNCPERGRFGLIGSFWATPPFATKPPFRFP